MDRRTFIAASGTVGLGTVASGLLAETPEVDGASQEFSAGSSPAGPALSGSPVVSGPSHEAITILQPLQRHATGYLEFAVDDAAFQRIDTDEAGLLPFEQYVLKFRLPPLPAGRRIRYRVTARTIGWVPVRNFVHGKIVAGTPEVGPEFSFRTLDPTSESTQFVVWNDTHENQQTLESLVEKTAEIAPDFLLWNGDQTNDVNFPARMANQLLSPGGLAIARQWPLAYVRGNHDVRGPAARHLPKFTGTPDDQFYYAFRSGPVAALVMDTGEDKADDHPNFAGLASFQRLRERQADWLAKVIKEPWFREAPFRVLFCHLPLWWIRDRKDIDWWEFSQVSREAWLPQLVEGRVNLVISGHTHQARWMPAGDKQPIGQLVGGAPQTQYATLIHGEATREKMKLKVTKLDGSVLHDLTFTATA